MKIDLNDLELGPVAECIRVRIERAIRASGKWHKTGHLLASLKAQAEKGAAGVSVASDRLENDEVAQKFFDEITPHDVDTATHNALQRALHDAVGIKRDR